MTHDETLAEEGVVAIQTFLSEGETARAKALVLAIYDELAQCSEFPNDGMRENFQMWNGVWLDPLRELLANRNTTLLFEYDDLLKLVVTRTRQKFGGYWRLYLARSFFRQHRGMTKKLAWHIDADAAATARQDCINIWIPLDRVGTELPSLEVVPRSHHAMKKLPLAVGAEQDRQDDFVARIGKPLVPQLNAGDALVFDHYTLHRTQEVPTKNIVRTACEFRFEGVTLRRRFGEARQRFFGKAR